MGDDTGVAVPSVIWNDSVRYMWYGGFDGIFGRTGLAIDTLYSGVIKNNNTLFPHKMILQGNYPNPFNPITTIHYSLPTKSFVTLKIFDVLGKKIVVLVNGNQQANEYRIKWDATNHTTGIYYYVLQSGNKIKIGKMLLLK